MPVMISRAAGASLLALMLSGCALAPGNSSHPYEPEEHPFMGMPSASHDDVESMFDLPDTWPEGAPTKAIIGGQEMGIWQPVGATEDGCMEYQLLPSDPRHVAPEVTHFWHGERYATESEGCVPVPEVVHNKSAEPNP